MLMWNGRSLGVGLIVLGVLAGGTESAAANWFSGLPQSVQDGILWSADHEEGALDDWTYPSFQYAGGGVFNTDGGVNNSVEAVASKDVAHSGLYSARATITGAYQETTRAVRLMRWTDTAWDDDGDYFPNQAYYSTWMYFPHTYDPTQDPAWDTQGDGGWWNIFQFKADDTNGDSQPVWVLNVDYDSPSDQMRFYLYSKYNTPASYLPDSPSVIAVGSWVHVEAFYDVSDTADGRIAIWVNGEQIFDIDNVVTSLPQSGGDADVIWGIGNYTDHIEGHPDEDGKAVIYFDDAAVSTVRVGQTIPEPATAVLLLASGLIAVSGRSRRGWANEARHDQAH